MLSDRDIRRAIKQGELKVENLSEGSIGPASIDLMLSPHFWVFRSTGERGAIDPKEDQTEVGHSVEVTEGASFYLRPGEFVLASSVERFHFPAHLGGRIEGKSSLGRLGLMVHVTAGFFDPGFVGYPTLELVNMRQRPILLWPGMPIAQMGIFRMASPSEIPYGVRGLSKYADQGPKPAPSKYHLNLLDLTE